MDQASSNSDQDDDIVIVEEFNEKSASKRKKHVVVINCTDDESESGEDADIIIIENNDESSVKKPKIEVFDIEEDNAIRESDSNEQNQGDYESDDDIVVIAENNDNSKANSKHVDAFKPEDVTIKKMGSKANNLALLAAAATAVASTSNSGDTSEQHSVLNEPKVEVLCDNYNFEELLELVDKADPNCQTFNQFAFVPLLQTEEDHGLKVESSEYFETISLSPENLKRRVIKNDLKLLLVLDDEKQNLIKVALSAKNITFNDLLDQVKTDYYLNYSDSTRVALVLDPMFGINYIVEIKPNDDTLWQKTTVTQELINAVKDSDLDLVRYLLAKKILPTNLKTYDLMISALRIGHSDIIKKLLNHGAPVVFSEEYGQNTLLHYAAGLADETIVKTLLYFSAELYSVNEKNETPIHVAAKSGNRKVLDKLLTHLVNVHKYHNVVDTDGLSLFHIVCMDQNSSYVVNFLENTTICINDTLSSTSLLWPGFSALHLAVSYYRYNTAQLLIQRGANLETRTASGLSTFQLACKMDDFKWMVCESVPHDLFDFFEKDLKLEQFKKNFDHLLQSRTNIIEMLIKAECDIDARDKNANNAMMNLISVDVSKSGITNWIKEKLATENINHIELSRSLLTARIETIQTILRHCSSCPLLPRSFSPMTLRDIVNAKNKFGFTCLHLTVKTNTEENEAIFNLLLQHGADINANSKQFVSPLHVATVTNHHRFIKCILYNDESSINKMANVNAQDRNGNTPLHNKYSRIDWSKLACNCIYSFLHFGADINIENEFGSTVYSLMIADFNKILSDEFFNLDVSNYDNTIDFKIDFKNDDFNSSHIRVDQTRSHKNDVIFVAELWKHFTKLNICNYYGHTCTDSFLEKVANKLHVTQQSIVSRNKFVHDCEEEVSTMKVTHVSQFVTLNDILCKHIDTVAAYTQNNALKELFQSPNLDEQFPIYGKMLKSRYFMATVRSSLLKEAKTSIENMIKLDIPELCVKKILSFLNEKKLRDIIEAHDQCKVNSVN